MSLAERLRPTTPTRRWVGVGAAALVWLALYEVNLPLWNWVVYDVAGLSPSSRLGSGVQFFFYDSIKIALLLIGIIFLVTVLRSFMSVERTRALLGGKREGVGNVMAAGLGVITPFCSCSAVRAFIGFVAAGVPLGVTLSFLIASPLVNEVAIGLLFGMFGIVPTLLYVGAGLVIADLGIDAQFEKVTDYPAIIGYGVMSTPALVVDEKVVLSGRVPTAAKVRELLES